MKICVFLLLFLSFSARGADVKASIGIGFGSTTIKFQDSQFSDNSGALLGVEYDISNRLGLQAEYYASGVFPGLKSSGSYSGGAIRWYFQTPMAQEVTETQVLQRSYLQQKNFALFVGGGLGYAASSVLTSTILESRGVANGIFGNFRFGGEYPFGSGWGGRTELLYGQLLSGTGSFGIADLVFSFYLFL